MHTTRIEYPGLDPLGEELSEPHVEHLTAELVDRRGRMALLTHSAFLPLGPGDIVTVDPTGLVTGIHSLRDGWIVEVLMNVNTTMEEVETAFLVWRRDVPLTITSGISARLSPISAGWVNDHVRPMPGVKFIRPLRRPGETAFNFEEERVKH